LSRVSPALSGGFAEALSGCRIALCMRVSLTLLAVEQ
jgi:hypothetical protein